MSVDQLKALMEYARRAAREGAKVIDQNNEQKMLKKAHFIFKVKNSNGKHLLNYVKILDLSVKKEVRILKAEIHKYISKQTGIKFSGSEIRFISAMLMQQGAIDTNTGTARIYLNVVPKSPKKIDKPQKP